MSPNTCSSKTMTLEFRAREVGYRTKVSVAQHKQASVMKTAAQEFFFWITMKLDRGGCMSRTNGTRGKRRLYWEWDWDWEINTHPESKGTGA